ncbi:MAG: hypothetical protein ABWY06_02990 [Pseudomonas sp.]|uniref:hypothetical protein n=1 Tax=Pseudomonas sp. TaxID=306 RepID=UPI003398A99F
MKNAGRALVLGLLIITLLGFYWQHDEPVSAEALAWLAAVQTPTQGRGAFMSLMGLDVPANESPEQFGQARLAGPGSFQDAASLATLAQPPRFDSAGNRCSGLRSLPGATA